MLRTVAPSSIVRRLVLKPSDEARPIVRPIMAASARKSFATASAAPTVPQVPCGCIVTRSFEAMPIRAPIS